MTYARTLAAISILAMLLAATTTVAQSPAPAPGSPTASSADQPKVSRSTGIRAWTKEKWEKLRQQLKTNDETFHECAKRAKERHVSIRELSRFVHACVSGREYVPISTRLNSWTKAQWERLKQRFRNDREKWAECQRQREGRKLSPYALQHFLYDCMTKGPTNG